MDYNNLREIAFQRLRKVDINLLKKINRALTIILVLISSFFLLDGLYIIFLTSGMVYGSEFSVQITIANLLAKLLLFLSVYFLWVYTDKIIQK